MIIGTLTLLTLLIVFITVIFRVLRGEPWREIKAEMKVLNKKEIPSYLIHSINMAFSLKRKARKEAREHRKEAKLLSARTFRDADGEQQ